jgi:hypothetical protein
MLSTRNLSALLTLCVVAVSCTSDNLTGVQTPRLASILIPQSPQELSADLVARGFAAAMSDPAIRIAVRDAMRASPLTEHKLGFQEFLHTPAGAALATAAAGKLSVTAAAFADAVSALPDMDFYIPDEVARKTWKGGADIRVGYLLNAAGETAPAYGPSGIVSRFIDGIGTPGKASFIIERAERKARRIGPQPSVPGDVIQDPNDGIIGGSIVEYLPDGTTRETDLADIYATGPVARPARSLAIDFGARISVPPPRFLVPVCDPDSRTCGGGGGGGGSGAPPDTTWLHEVEVIHVCDNANCGETNEFEWHTYYSSNSGSTWSNRLDVRLVGFPSTYDALVDYIALYKKLVSSNERLTSDVVETDGTSGDDHFTPSPIYNALEDVFMRPEGGYQCGFWPRYQNAPEDCNAFPWSEVQQSFLW